MLEWLEKSFTENAPPHLKVGELAACLLLSLAFGAVVAGIYVWTQRKSRTDLLPFATTIVLLTVLISMVTMIIGNNVARAFSLAGALAIIRFRTVVEDTRDTAFVIFAVVVGMGVGAGMIIVPLIGTPILGAAALAMSHLGRPTVRTGPADYLLSVRIVLGRDPSSVLKELFAVYVISASAGHHDGPARIGPRFELSGALAQGIRCRELRDRSQQDRRCAKRGTAADVTAIFV